MRPTDHGVCTKAAIRRDAEAVKVRGNLSAKNGEISVNSALDGHGILMRTEWDIKRYIKSGRLVHVLPVYRTPDADIYAIYPNAVVK